MIIIGFHGKYIHIMIYCLKIIISITNLTYTVSIQKYIAFFIFTSHFFPRSIFTSILISTPFFLSFFLSFFLRLFILPIFLSHFPHFDFLLFFHVFSFFPCFIFLYLRCVSFFFSFSFLLFSFFRSCHSLIFIFFHFCDSAHSLGQIILLFFFLFCFSL